MTKTLSKLNREDALYCSGIFNDYFGQFDRVDQYMKDQKLAQLEDSVSASLPGMGPEDDLFTDFTMSPEDMDFEVYEPTDNTSYVTLLNMTSSHTNMPSIPGKELKLLVKEKNTDKIMGFIRFGSPVINSAPRNQVLGQVPNLKQFNKNAIMGFTIVPTQPFGFNYLGGKLLAAICCSHKVKDILDKKYNMNLVMFETTSLYGSSKSSSQYDGMKPYLRFKGLTDSHFLPLLHGEAFKKMNAWFTERNGEPLVDADASSRKLKIQTKMVSIIKESLKQYDANLYDKFSKFVNKTRDLTEQKRFYMSDYGYENVPQYLKRETDELKKGIHYDKFTLENTIKWWQKLATKRFNKLKQNNNIRNELEIWHDKAEIQIIR